VCSSTRLTTDGRAPVSPFRHEINAPTGFERSVSMHAVRFYTAQVLLGLEALHSNGYIYRCVAPFITPP
jgi:serine/threonine protein kinase